MKGIVYGTLAILTFAACVSTAAPEPAIVPGPDQWTVEVTFAHPQEITLQSSGDSGPRQFWYTLITITNKAGRDVDFYPKCDLMTDTFQVLPAGRRVPGGVFEQIQKRHKGRYPFLESLETCGSKILQGEDNTKDIAIIWSDFEAKAKGIKLFITGLSNETVAIKHPVAKDETGKAKQVLLRKTLELVYDLPGDATLRSADQLVYKNKRWVMR